MQPRKYASLLQVVDAVREHAGSNNDEDGAGPGEEAGEVDAHYPAVDEVAEQHGSQDAECCAGEVRIDFVAEFATETARGAENPEDHPRDKNGGDNREDAADESASTGPCRLVDNWVVW